MNKCILVLINGRAGVGKDTFVEFCQDYAQEMYPCKVYNIHRSDAPKIALQALGWKGDKDESARSLLKHMVDFMEEKHLLNGYLNEQISAAKLVSEKDCIIFYHVRDPEIIYGLMDEYIESEEIRPISLLLQRNIDTLEPNDWWGDLEEAEYTMRAQLPKNDIEKSKEMAAAFVDFLLLEDWEVVKNE